MAKSGGTQCLMLGMLGLLVACGGKGDKTNTPKLSPSTTGAQMHASATGSSPGSISTAASTGTGGTVTTGQSTTGLAVGGDGGAGGMRTTCMAKPQQLSGCYGITDAAGGQQGLGGAAGAASIDPCWRTDRSWAAGSDEICEATFEGTVTFAGYRDDTDTCASTMFSGTPEPGRSFAISISSEQLELFVSMSAVGRQLAIAPGNAAQAWIYRNDFGMSILTITSGDQLVALMNDGPEIDFPPSTTDLELKRGAETCRGLQDDFSCTEVGSEIAVSYGTQQVGIEPYGRTQIGPYEIVVDRNADFDSGGGCDYAAVSEYAIFRLD